MVRDLLIHKNQNERACDHHQNNNLYESSLHISGNGVNISVLPNNIRRFVCFDKLDFSAQNFFKIGREYLLFYLKIYRLCSINSFLSFKCDEYATRSSQFLQFFLLKKFVFNPIIHLLYSAIITIVYAISSKHQESYKLTIIKSKSYLSNF